MAESQNERIVNEFNLNFFFQSIVGEYGDGTRYYKLKIKIKDRNGKEIEHIIDCPTQYFTQDVLKNIRKLLDYYKYAQSDKIKEATKEEVLIWLALIIARVA
jgi:hypothetical protein